jgi:hypothetical protein
MPRRKIKAECREMEFVLPKRKHFVKTLNSLSVDKE